MCGYSMSLAGACCARTVLWHTGLGAGVSAAACLLGGSVADLLASQLGQLAFAVITGQCRLTTEHRAGLADLNAAAAIIDQAEACETAPRLHLVPRTSKETA